MNQKSKSTAAILAFFLGCWGTHNFYVGQKKKGIILLIIGIIGLFSFFPLLITGIIALIDFIKYLTMSDAEFQILCENNNGETYPSSSISSQNRNGMYNTIAENESNIHNVEYTFCTECGSKMVKGTKFCPMCGCKQ